MRKVLVDRELLERVTALLEWDGMDDTTPLEFGAKCDSLCKELADYIAQPAEVEGTAEMGSDAWMALHLLDRLDVSADEELRVQQVEEIVRRMGAALSAVTAERGALRVEVESMRKDAERYRRIRNPDQVVGHVIDKMVSSGVYEYRAGDELDDAIDDAMQQS